MGKELCKKKKLLKKDVAAYMKYVMDPRYVCGKCGRVASKKKRLCRPAKIP